MYIILYNLSIINVNEEIVCVYVCVNKHKIHASVKLGLAISETMGISHLITPRGGDRVNYVMRVHILLLQKRLLVLDIMADKMKVGRNVAIPRGRHMKSVCFADGHSMIFVFNSNAN